MADVIRFPDSGGAADFVERLKKGPTEIKQGKWDGAVLVVKEHVIQNLAKYARRKDLLCVVVKLQVDGFSDCTGVILHNNETVNLDVSRWGKSMDDLMSQQEKDVYLDKLEQAFVQLKEHCQPFPKVIKSIQSKWGWESDVAYSIDRALRLSNY
jgi:hypothetical protein